jgi:ABC-type sulfate transport system permease component
MRREPFFWITVSCGLVIMAFILLPLIQMMTAPSAGMLKETIQDKDVVRSIWLSIYTAGLAALISFVLGTPLAYLLARSSFRGKRLVESIIDLPIAIPHPVVGIAILSVAGKNHWIGQILSELGIRIMGSVTGIVTVLTFVVLRPSPLVWRRYPGASGPLCPAPFSASPFPLHGGACLLALSCAAPAPSANSEQWLLLPITP